jgi:hypothetical protein
LTTDETGLQLEYHPFGEWPPEIQAAVERARKGIS